MSKKTLKEMFEFFPECQWITRGSSDAVITLFNLKERPCVVAKDIWIRSDYKNKDFDSDKSGMFCIHSYKNFLIFEWENTKGIMIASRKEIMSLPKPS